MDVFSSAACFPCGRFADFASCHNTSKPCASLQSLGFFLLKITFFVERAQFFAQFFGDNVALFCTYNMFRSGCLLLYQRIHPHKVQKNYKIAKYFALSLCALFCTFALYALQRSAYPSCAKEKNRCTISGMMQRFFSCFVKGL